MLTAKEVVYHVARVPTAVDVSVVPTHAAVDKAEEGRDMIGEDRVLAASESHEQRDPHVDMREHDRVVTAARGEVERAADRVILQSEIRVSRSTGLQDVQARHVT